ncbi:MAG: beta-phosphoglucomutase [Bacteroidia bacterium]|nr:beta-phosphoglucomutase [Bacteroidia bacterium]
MHRLEACVFDLDGVIVDTAKYHYQAWKDLANSLGFDFSEAQNELLKGVSRMGSLDLILQWGGVEKSKKEKEALAAWKNEHYLELIESLGIQDALPGVVDFLKELSKHGIKIGLGSASKNAVKIISKLKLNSHFDAIVDGTQVTNGKPHPETFQLACEKLKVAPKNTIVFEDAPKGVQAALSGGMVAVGVGSEESLSEAHLVIAGFESLYLEHLINKLPTLELTASTSN